MVTEPASVPTPSGPPIGTGWWRTGPLTAGQLREVQRLGGQVTRNRDVATDILALAKELKTTTVEAILGKSDLELGLELLAGRSPLFSQGWQRKAQP